MFHYCKLAAPIVVLALAASAPQAQHDEHLMHCARACDDCARICDACSMHCAKLSNSQDARKSRNRGAIS